MSESQPVIRPVHLESAEDLAAAFSIVRDCELSAVGWTDSTLESVTSQLTAPDAWRELHRIAFIDGVAQGLLAADLDRDAREVFLDAFAIGERANELQRLLLQGGLAAAGNVAADDNEASSVGVEDPLLMTERFWQVLAASFIDDSALAAVLSSLGFTPIRRFWRMLCDLKDVSAIEPQAPDGATRRVVAGEADERVLHRLFHDSFSEHFGHTVEESYESWIARVRANPGNREDGWWIAELDGQPVAMCIVDDSKADFGEGYVRTLGVLERARGRGIGRWLLECAAADAVRRGRTAIALAVDGANTTGATALYESVGYRTRQVIELYCYPLVDSALSR
jgi:ribosomal protein S18 acetylase RimI-like enzyme